MTSETDKTRESTAVSCLIVRAEDGGAYAVPLADLESYRLTDTQWAALDGQIGTSGADVDGFGVGPNGEFIGEFPDWVMVKQHVEHVGVVPVRLPAWIVINRNREDPNGYHPPLR